MAKDVICNVETCKHQCNGKCHAKCIQVGNCQCSKAKDISETACDTFELK